MTSNLAPNLFEVAMSLGRAHDGDFSVLVERLRSSAPLDNDERQFLADLIEGKRKRRPGRPPALHDELRDVAMIERFLFAQAVGATPKVAEVVASMFGMQADSLHRVHRGLKRDADRYGDLCNRVERMVASYRRLVALRDRRELVQRRWDERRAKRALAGGRVGVV